MLTVKQLLFYKLLVEVSTLCGSVVNNNNDMSLSMIYLHGASDNTPVRPSVVIHITL